MKVIKILAFLLSFASLQAQQIWSLEDCINHALINNISLKQNKLTIELNENSYSQSKFQRYPSVNANSSANRNTGRSVNPNTNQFIEEVITSVNFSYSSNITLFNGFKNTNQIKKAANELLKSKYDLESSKNELISSIALSYLQILFNKELFYTSTKQLDLIKAQETRIKTLVEAGSLAKGELLNIQSQKALEEQRLIQAENQLNLSKLQLAQLLEIENYQDLTIEAEQIKIPKFILKNNINEDYKAALSIQSTIKASELAISSSLYDYKIARANYLPSLSLSHSISSLYIDNVSDLISPNSQLQNNLQGGISFRLTIPIFNNWNTRTSVNQSIIQIENSKLIAQQTKNQLRKNMEQSYADQLAAYKRLQAAQKAADAFKESFTYITNRYELGMVNSYEFNESKNNLIKAESDELQAKYDLIFKIKLYEFYTQLKFEL